LAVAQKDGMVCPSLPDKIAALLCHDEPVSEIFGTLFVRRHESVRLILHLIGFPIPVLIGVRIGNVAASTDLRYNPTVVSSGREAFEE